MRRFLVEKYNTITVYEVMRLSVKELTDRYNDAVETIWDLEQRLYDERLENEQLWQAYEELQNKIFG